jgi:hypothetical protein
MDSHIKIKIFNERDDGNIGIKLTSADSDAFQFAISELKSVVPADYRRYEPDKKIWLISASLFVEDWLDVLRMRLDVEVERVGARQTYHHRRQEQKWQPPPPPTQSIALPFATLHLLPDAPPEVVKASYKALAKIYHPDVRGDSAKMVEINRAYETITRRV